MQRSRGVRPLPALRRHCASLLRVCGPTSAYLTVTALNSLQNFIMLIPSDPSA